MSRSAEEEEWEMAPKYSRHASMDKAEQEIFDAVRFLAPSEAEYLLRQLADGMKKLADKYDRLLEEHICG